MMPSAYELEYFIELTETLNFSRAAERIGISQPSLSAAIKRLETAVGVPLFIRIKTGVKLTPAGKQLLARARQLLQSWDHVRIEAVSAHDEIKGKFTLGCHVSVGLHVLSDILSDLLLKYPNLTVNLQHDISRKILSAVINLTLDVGIVINPIRHPDLILHKLYDDKTTFWTTNNRPTKNQQLDSEQLVIICDESLTQTEWLLKKLHKMQVKQYRLLNSSSFELTANLVAAGAGIGIIPNSIAASNFQKRIKLMPEMPGYQDEAYLVYRHENREIKPIRVMYEAIKNGVSKLLHLQNSR